jgi:predicted NBD/HSP70 family sugar kinase
MIRVENTRSIVNTLRGGQGLTIGEICKKTKISRVTVDSILSSLEKQHIIVIEGLRSSTKVGGKPPRVFKLVSNSVYTVGIHFAIDFMYGVLFDINYDVVCSEKVAIHLNAPLSDLTSVINQLMNTLLFDAGLSIEDIAGLGFGGHGIIDMLKGLVITSPHNPVWGDHVQLRELLKTTIGREDLPIFVDNSIRFRVVAEQIFGKLHEARDAIVIHTTNTGLISGLVINRKIQRGNDNLVGAIGHMMINPSDNRVCGCGGRGCFEVQIAPDYVLEKFGPQMSDDFKLKIGYMKESTDYQFLQVFAYADEGDPEAQSIIDNVAYWFAVGLHNTMVVINPTLVILQGIYGLCGEYFLSRLNEELHQISLIKAELSVRIEKSDLGEDSAALGAAAVAMNEFIGQSGVNHE